MVVLLGCLQGLGLYNGGFWRCGEENMFFWGGMVVEIEVRAERVIGGKGSKL